MCVGIRLWFACDSFYFSGWIFKTAFQPVVKSDDVATIVGTYFLIVSIGYVLNTVTNCYLGSMNGMGKPSKSMFLMIFYYIVIRMPLAYLLSYLDFGLNGIWVAVLASHVVASVAAGISGTISFKKRTSIT